MDVKQHNNNNFTLRVDPIFGCFFVQESKEEVTNNFPLQIQQENVDVSISLFLFSTFIVDKLYCDVTSQVRFLFQALQAPACHENMVKVGGYILGEFGNLIAGDPRSR